MVTRTTTATLSSKKRGWVFQGSAHQYGRSGLEDDVQKQLTEAGVPFEYETLKLKYEMPATVHTYTPDFKLPNGIIIETKGIFDADDRKKHLLVKAQHPDLDIRFVFTNSKQRLTKSKVLSPAAFKAWLLETQGKTVGFSKDQRAALKEQFEAGTKSRGDTYATWCHKHGFLYADKLIPASWISEPPKDQ